MLFSEAGLVFSNPFQTSTQHARKQNKSYYVYILQSEIESEQFYTGFTEDPEKRLSEHNSGKCSHTSKYRPWKLKTMVTYTNKDKAISFEQYLKTRSGRAFSKNVYK